MESMDRVKSFFLSVSVKLLILILKEKTKAMEYYCAVSSDECFVIKVMACKYWYTVKDIWLN